MGMIYKRGEVLVYNVLVRIRALPSRHCSGVK